MLIGSGHCEIAVAGGCEQTDPHFHAGFDSMRAYNSEDNDHPERASRPYAADRAGFIFAEGAGIVVLEAREVAEARGATILGTLRGWGMSSDGEGDMVAPSSDGARRAIEAESGQNKSARPNERGYGVVPDALTCPIRQRWEHKQTDGRERERYRCQQSYLECRQLTAADLSNDGGQEKREGVDRHNHREEHCR